MILNFLTLLNYVTQCLVKRISETFSRFDDMTKTLTGSLYKMALYLLIPVLNMSFVTQKALTLSFILYTALHLRIGKKMDTGKVFGTTQTVRLCVTIFSGSRQKMVSGNGLRKKQLRQSKTIKNMKMRFPIKCRWRNTGNQLDVNSSSYGVT